MFERIKKWLKNWKEGFWEGYNLEMARRGRTNLQHKKKEKE